MANGYQIRDITVCADKIERLAKDVLEDAPELLECYTVKDVQFAVRRGLGDAIDRLVDNFHEWAFGPSMTMQILVDYKNICEADNCTAKVKRDKETGKYYRFCYKHQAEEDARKAATVQVIDDLPF